jgi:hypothetical protein
MIDLTTEVIAITIDSSFLKARPFSKEQLDQLALNLLEVFKESGLRPEHIGIRATDLLFGYELNLGLYGGSATVRTTSSQLTLNFQNVRNRSALETVAGTVLKVHGLFKPDDFAEHAFGIVAHLSFRDEAQRKDAAKIFEDSERQIEFVGRLVHIRTAEWPESIRLEIDRSMFFPGGLFMSWNSKWRGTVDLKMLGDIFESLAVTSKRLDFDIAIP